MAESPYSPLPDADRPAVVAFLTWLCPHVGPQRAAAAAHDEFPHVGSITLLDLARTIPR